MHRTTWPQGWIAIIALLALSGLSALAHARALPAGQASPTDPITGFVWYDSNADGSHAADEPGLPDVSVELWNVAKTERLAETRTDASGYYSFPLPDVAGFRVRVVLPDANHVFSPKARSRSEERIDSDINDTGPDAGFSAPIIALVGATELEPVNAGMIRYCALAPTPTFTPSPTPTLTPSPAISALPVTATDGPTATATPTPTPSPTPTPLMPCLPPRTSTPAPTMVYVPPASSTPTDEPAPPPDSGPASAPAPIPSDTPAPPTATPTITATVPPTSPTATGTFTATPTLVPPTLTSTFTATPTLVPPTLTGTFTATPTLVPPTLTSTFTATPTLVPPTLTSTFTATPTLVPPTLTSTFTATPTLVPPTFTSTFTATPTLASPTPTSTFTPTPTPSLVTLGDFVWHDLNGDGQQDADEPGIADVTVQLWNDTKTLLIDSTVTDASGIYALVAPAPGSYRIRVLLQNPGDTFSPMDQAGGDDTLDSDINPSGPNAGFTDVINIGPSAVSITTIDAGIIVSPALLSSSFSSGDDLGLLPVPATATPTPAPTRRPVATSVPPPATNLCGAFRLTSPLDGLPNGVATFYWDPVNAPNVTYVVTVMDEGGNGLTSFSVSNATSVSGNVSQGAIGGAFQLIVRVTAVVNGRSLCSDQRVIFRAAPPPDAPPAPPNQPAPTCVPGNIACFNNDGNTP